MFLKKKFFLIHHILKYVSSSYLFEWKGFLFFLFVTVIFEFSAESGSNLESDFEDEMKKQVRTEAETDAEKIPLDVSKAPLCIRSSSFSSSISFMPSLSVIKAPNLPDCFRTLTLPTHSSSLSNSSSTALSLKPKGLTGESFFLQHFH